MGEGSSTDNDNWIARSPLSAAYRINTYPGAGRFNRKSPDRKISDSHQEAVLAAQTHFRPNSAIQAVPEAKSAVLSMPSNSLNAQSAPTDQNPSLSSNPNSSPVYYHSPELRDAP